MRMSLRVDSGRRRMAGSKWAVTTPNLVLALCEVKIHRLSTRKKGTRWRASNDNRGKEDPPATASNGRKV